MKDILSRLVKRKYMAMLLVAMPLGHYFIYYSTISLFGIRDAKVEARLTIILII